MPKRAETTVLLLGVFATIVSAARVEALDVWTPQTGEVELEALPRDTADARRVHALALIGAGQWAGGVAELRALILAHI